MLHPRHVGHAPSTSSGLSKNPFPIRAPCAPSCAMTHGTLRSRHRSFRPAGPVMCVTGIILPVGSDKFDKFQTGGTPLPHADARSGRAESAAAHSVEGRDFTPNNMVRMRRTVTRAKSAPPASRSATKIAVFGLDSARNSSPPVATSSPVDTAMLLNGSGLVLITARVPAFAA